MKHKKYWGLIILGVSLVAMGIFIIKGILIWPTPIALPYILIGIGAGLLGHGFGEIWSQKLLKQSPEIEKKLFIEKNDERNRLIAQRAKAKAYDNMFYTFGALLLALVLMKKVPLAPVLMVVFAYLWVIGVGIYYRIKYEKEM